MIPYRRLIPFKSIPYWTFWMGVSVLSYLLSELAVLLFEETYYGITRITLSVLLGGLPILYIYLFDELSRTLEKYKTILVDKDEIEEKFEEIKNNIFQFTPISISIILVGAILVLITIINLGMPLENIWANVIILFEVMLLIIPAFHGFSIFIKLIPFFGNIQKLNIEIPFFHLPNKYINRIENYWWLMTFLITAFYFIFALFVTNSPYWFRIELFLWLSLIGIIPLSLFIWSLFQIHLIIKEVKYNHLGIINSLIQDSLKCAQKDQNKDNIEKLDKLIEVQKKVSDIREWNLSIESFLTFSVALLTLISQVILLLNNIKS